MEVPVLALLSKQLEGELQLARFHHVPWLVFYSVPLVESSDSKVLFGRGVGRKEVWLLGGSPSCLFWIIQAYPDFIPQLVFHTRILIPS